MWQMKNSSGTSVPVFMRIFEFAHEPSYTRVCVRHSFLWFEIVTLQETGNPIRVNWRLTSNLVLGFCVFVLFVWCFQNIIAF